MLAKHEVAPKDLIPIAKTILRRRLGEWMSPQAIWEHVRQVDPYLADEVELKVQRYKNPRRNNAVWFVSNTLYHLQKLPGFTVSNSREEPSVKDKDVWLIARAEP